MPYAVFTYHSSESCIFCHYIKSVFFRKRAIWCLLPFCVFCHFVPSAVLCVCRFVHLLLCFMLFCLSAVLCVCRFVIFRFVCASFHPTKQLSFTCQGRRHDRCRDLVFPHGVDVPVWRDVHLVGVDATRAGARVTDHVSTFADFSTRDLRIFPRPAWPIFRSSSDGTGRILSLLNKFYRPYIKSVFFRKRAIWCLLPFCVLPFCAFCRFVRLPFCASVVMFYAVLFVCRFVCLPFRDLSFCMCIIPSHQATVLHSS